MLQDRINELAEDLYERGIENALEVADLVICKGMTVAEAISELEKEEQA